VVHGIGIKFPLLKDNFHDFLKSRLIIRFKEFRRKISDNESILIKRRIFATKGDENSIAEKYYYISLKCLVIITFQKKAG